MPYLILACAVVSLLLIGCSPMKERQERAQRILDSATEQVVEGIDTVKNVQADLQKGIADTAEKIQGGTEELKQRAEAIQNGARQVSDAISEIKEGTEAVKGALNVSGSERE